jgi:hypothetical protein
VSIPIRFKRGSSAALSGVNPLFESGELVYETDTLKLKIGDGETLYNNLPIVFSGVYLQNIIDDNSPHLGNNLDINSYNILGTGNIDVSGVITASGGNSNNWNSAYTWGDHSTSGYLTDISSQNIQDLNNVISDLGYPLLVNEYTLIYDSGINQFKGSTINLGLIRQGSIPLTGYNTSYLGYYIRMNNGEFTINEQGDDLDFRVEGDSAQYLFFTDASSDSIGIGTSAPAAPLHLVRPKNAIYGSVLIQDSTPMAQNVGGSIVFGGRYTSGNDDARFGQIAALKENSTDGDAKSVLSFTTNDGSSFTEKMRILPSGNVALGSTGSDSHRFSVRGNINQNNAIGIFSDTAYGSAATSGNIYDVYSRGQINAYTLQNHYHFFTSVPALTNGATVNNELCYTASHSASGVVSQRGFYSTINGDSSWQLYMGGTAPSYINGNLGIGISNPSNKLQVENGNVVFNSAAGNYDFTVGGDTDVHTLCVDASADSVGIGIATPLSTLHIEKNTIPSIRIQRSAAVGTTSVPAERGHILFSNYNNTYDHIKLISWGRESNFLAGMLGVNISNSAGVSSEVLTIDNQSTAGTFGLRTYNIPLVTTSGNVTFNETAGDYDFRVEGVTDPNLLFTDASTNRVGIGTSTPASTLHVNGEIRASGNLVPATDNTGAVGTAALTWNNGQFTDLTVDSTLTVTSTLNVRAAIDLADNDILRFGDADDWEMYHNGTSNFIDLTVGDLIIRDDATAGDPVRMVIQRAGNVGIGTSSPTSRLTVDSGNVVFNESGGNFDFRVEGDSDENLLFVDASTDRVGIGTSSPTHKLHVAGSGYMDWTQLQSNYYINYPIPASIPGMFIIGDQIILFAPTGVATLFRGYIDSNSTATSNEYLRNFSRTFIHYRTSADANTVPQVTVNGVYNGNQSDLAANDNGRVVKVLHLGVEYWGLIMQDLDVLAHPGEPVFNGYASSLTHLQYGHRASFPTVTDITPNATAGRSASIFRYQNLSVPDGNVGIGTNNPSVRLDVEGGDIVFNDLGDNFDFRVEGDADANLLFVDASADRVGIGTNEPTEKLDINSDAIRIRTAQTPASATATGNVGDICWDSNYIYVCVATNTWKRSSLASW